MKSKIKSKSPADRRRGGSSKAMTANGREIVQSLSEVNEAERSGESPHNRADVRALRGEGLIDPSYDYRAARQRKANKPVTP
jgi:hypothetical protein